MGTYLGHPVQGALANTRAIGPVLAGMIGGPVSGNRCGVYRWLHRYYQGGFTAFSCGLSTTTEGLVGGLLCLYLTRRNKLQDIFNPGVAFLTAAVAETLQMVIILAVSRPFSEALALVKVIALPMIVTSSCDCAIFMSIIRDQRDMYDRAAAAFSSKAFNIVERSLASCRRNSIGKQLMRWPRSYARKRASAPLPLLTPKRCCPSSGSGPNTHLPDTPISSPLTRMAIKENRVAFADGAQDITDVSFLRHVHSILYL